MLPKPKKIIVASIGVVLLLAVSALFTFGGWERTVVGKYRIQQWEDFETYYLNKKGQEDSGGGIIDGTVRRIGWSNHYIIVERHANYRGDPDGWMVIDVNTDKITGPITEAEFRARPELKDIPIYQASEAWKKLLFSPFSK
jgi:hypothetical protein